MSKRGRDGEQTNEAILKKLNLAIRNESVVDVLLSLETIPNSSEKETYFSNIPIDSNPLLLAAKCDNLEIVKLLVNSVFGDKRESLEEAYDIAYKHGKDAIRRFLDGALDAIYEEESNYDDEEDEEAAAPEPDSAAAGDARPSILTSNRIPYLDLARALAGATISHDEHDDPDEDEEEAPAHSPNFGIPLGREAVSFDASSRAVAATLAISACASAALAAPAAAVDLTPSSTTSTVSTADVAAPSSDERTLSDDSTLQPDDIDLTGVTIGPNGVYFV